MAVAAIVTVVYQLRADLHQRENELAQRKKESAERDAIEIHNWQRTIVRNILAAAKDPLSSDELHRRYLAEIQNVAYRKRIPEKQYSKEELGRVLLDLQSSGVVGYDESQEYFLRKDTSHFAGQLMQQMAIVSEQRKVESTLMRKLLAKPNDDPDPTINDLYVTIKADTQTPLTIEQFYEVVANLMRSQIVEITKESQVRVIVRDGRQVAPSKYTTKEVMYIWVPTGDEYKQHKDALEEWLSDNFEWSGKSPLSNRLTVDGKPQFVDGWKYECESPHDDSEVLKAEDSSLHAQQKVTEILKLKNAEAVWVEIEGIQEL